MWKVEPQKEKQNKQKTNKQKQRKQIARKRAGKLRGFFLTILLTAQQRKRLFLSKLDITPYNEERGEEV